MPTRIGDDFHVYDTVTVTYSSGRFHATARRGVLVGRVRVPYDYGAATVSGQAYGAAWRARLKLADAWRAESARLDVSDEYADVIADPDAWRGVVARVGDGYVVTYVPAS